MSVGEAGIGGGGRRAAGGQGGGAFPGCPEPGILAAYVDRRLSRAEVAAVEGHLADCDACRDLLAEAVRALEDIEQDEDVVPSWRRGRAVALAGLAAAAVVALAIALPWPAWRDWLGGKPPAPSSATPAPGAAPERRQALIVALGAMRLFDARLTGGFQPGPVRGVTRSGSTGARPGLGLFEDALSPGVRVATAEIEAWAAQEPSPEAEALKGVAQLVEGRIDEAIASLEAAAAARCLDARLLNDLAAAYIVRATYFPDRRVQAGIPLADADRALDAIDRALSHDPALVEALFNRALALEVAGRPQEARATWSAYIDRDPDSPWAREARQHVADLDAAQPR
jgi:hypothetical protein